MELCLLIWSSFLLGKEIVRLYGWDQHGLSAGARQERADPDRQARASLSLLAEPGGTRKTYGTAVPSTAGKGCPAPGAAHAELLVVRPHNVHTSDVAVRCSAVFVDSPVQRRLRTFLWFGHRSLDWKLRPVLPIHVLSDRPARWAEVGLNAEQRKESLIHEQ